MKMFLTICAVVTILVGPGFSAPRKDKEEGLTENLKKFVNTSCVKEEDYYVLSIKEWKSNLDVETDWTDVKIVALARKFFVERYTNLEVIDTIALPDGRNGIRTTAGTLMIYYKNKSPSQLRR